MKCKLFDKRSTMESYLKSWEGIAKEYQNFSRQSPDECEMKNSLKYEEEKFGCDDSQTDSLPLRCIVQTFSSLRHLKSPQCQHCENKSVSADYWWECECEKNEMSGCIAVPEDTTMNDLVKTALVKLGYPASVSLYATGSLLIRNWKPLPLEEICLDMKKAVVSDILGEISAVVSLRIQIFRPKITIIQKIKDNLLLFFIKANQNFLRDNRCPFDVSLLSKFCDQSAYIKMQPFQEPLEGLQRKFDAWLEHVQVAEKATAGRKTPFPTSFFFPNHKRNVYEANSQNTERGSQNPVESSSQETNGKQLKMPAEKENLNFAKESSLSTMDKHQQFSTPKTRVRTSFDPEFELPKLQKWYLKNPHPSRQQIYDYVAELNSLESRKGRKQLDVNNVVYWFKNARAAQKRTECRKFTNTSVDESSRCSALKIPLGKNCGVNSDDQISISDGEASVISESGEDCQQENRRCLQVVGKWNSNGQGEAVLEMQIPSRKTDFATSILQAKQDKQNEEISGSVQEEISDSTREDSFSEKKEKMSEKSLIQIENQKSGAAVENKNDIKIHEVTGSKQKQSDEDNKKNEISSPKISIKSIHTDYKENNSITSSEFLTPYKSGFPVPSNSILNPSFICMPQYVSPKPSSLTLSSEERRKRNRTFIDPVTEVPRLEQWFRLSTHPSHSLIARYTAELNNMPYRRKFPKLEVKNVQFWFKNRRAKNKRLNYLETNNN